MTLQRTYSAGQRCKFINLDQTDWMDYFDIYPTFIKKQASRNSFDISYELNNFETHFSYTQYFNYLNIELTSNQDSFYTVYMILPNKLPKKFILNSKIDDFALILYYYGNIDQNFINWVNKIKINSPGNIGMIKINILGDSPISSTQLQSGHSVTINKINYILHTLKNVHQVG